VCLSVEDRGCAEGHAHQSGGADALSSGHDQVQVAVGAVLPALAPVDLSAHAEAGEGADGHVTGARSLVAVGNPATRAVRGDVHVEQVAVPFGVSVSGETTEVVTGVLYVTQSLESEDVGLVRSAAGAVGAPHGASEAADQGVVEVQVDRHVEADVPHGRATESVAVGGELALELHPTDDAAVDGEAGGGEIGDGGALPGLLLLEPVLGGFPRDALVLDLGRELAVGLDALAALDPVGFLARLGLVHHGVGQDVVGGEQVVHEAVAGLVGGLDVVDSVTELDVAFQPLLGLTLDDRRGDLRGFGLSRGLGGAAVDGLGRCGLLLRLLTEDVLGVGPCHGLDDLEVTVGRDDLGGSEVGVAPDVVVGAGGGDADVALHQVHLALSRCGAASELEDEPVGGERPTAVLVGLQSGQVAVQDGPGSEARGVLQVGAVTVVVDPVADHFGQQGGLGRLGVVAVEVLGLDADVEVIHLGVTVDVNGRGPGTIPVRVDRGGVGAGSERSRAHQAQGQRQDHDSGGLHLCLQ